MNSYQLDRIATKAFLAWTKAGPETEAQARKEMEKAIKALNDYGEAWKTKHKEAAASTHASDGQPNQ